MSEKTKLHNFIILRPLINQKKKDLVFISKKVFNFFVKDPSNNDEKFQRVRIRKLLKGLENDGLDQNKFIKTIENLKRSNDVVNYHVKKNLENNSFFSSKKKYLILNDKFFKQPYEIVFRSLTDSLSFVSKKYYSVRGKKLRELSKIFKKIPFLHTLGSCFMKKSTKQSLSQKNNNFHQYEPNCHLLNLNNFILRVYLKYSNVGIIVFLTIVFNMFKNPQ